MKTEAEPMVVHVNTRIRAMQSRLFTRERFEDLLDQNDITLLIEVLLSSPYETEMAQALARYKGPEAVEDAVTRNFGETFRRLVALSEGRYAELAVIFFTRWDLASVKTLLRNRHYGLEGDAALPALTPGPHMGVPLLRDMASMESMEGLVSRLALWDPDLCGGLPGALEAYRDGKDLAVLEETLDRAFFVDRTRGLKSAEDVDATLLHHVLQMEIDRINLRTILRRGAEPAQVRAKLMPEGTLRPRLLDAMAKAPGPAEAMELLGPTPYRELVERLYGFLQTGRFAPLERLFESFILDYLRRMARQHVLSIAVLMRYAWLKYNEIMNLRLIALGEARHLPPGLIREELMYA